MLSWDPFFPVVLIRQPYCTMAKNSNKPINVPLGFEGAEKYDETRDAKMIANYFNTNHLEIVYSSQRGKFVTQNGSSFLTSLLVIRRQY